MQSSMRSARPRRWQPILVLAGAALTLVPLALAPGAVVAALLVVAVPALIYLALPGGAVSLAIGAMAHSAIAVPLWLLPLRPAGPAIGEVISVCGLLALLHVLGMWQRLRARRERCSQRERHDALLTLSAVDPLTGLPNRRAIDEHLARSWGQWVDAGVPLSVVMVDIDHFKRLNDTQGHLVGDSALRTVAQVVRGAVPAEFGAIVGRYGGEEFLCLLPGVDAAGATVVAGCILAAVRSSRVPLSGAASGPVLTVSAGVSAADALVTSPEMLIAAADSQLYRAKSAGRNCVRAEPMALVCA